MTTSNLVMITHPKDTGQIVQTSYSQSVCGGWGYKRVLDQSEPPGSPERERWYRIWVAGRLWNDGPVDWISENWRPTARPGTAAATERWIVRRVCVPCKLAVRSSYRPDECPGCGGPLERRELAASGPFKLRARSEHSEA